MQLFVVPAFADNYIWMLADGGGNALAVDPGEAAPVEDFLAAHRLRLTSILITHHHADHTGGVAELVARHGATVLAPDDDRIAQADVRVQGGESIQLNAPEARFSVLAVPGHTRSHVAWFGEGKLFSGDTLFSLGCGRLFEGTPAQMLASLDCLSILPGDTELCCGHEYTLDNAAFALAVDPENPDLAARVAHVRELRATGLPSLPSTIGVELRTNPFLRIDSPALKAWAEREGAGPHRAERFAALRRAKDAFRA